MLVICDGCGIHVSKCGRLHYTNPPGHGALVLKLCKSCRTKKLKLPANCRTKEGL